MKWAQDIEWGRLALGVARILGGTLVVLLLWNLGARGLQSLPGIVGKFVLVVAGVALVGFMLLAAVMFVIFLFALLRFMWGTARGFFVRHAS